jgi:hypothetical protein
MTSLRLIRVALCLGCRCPLTGPEDDRTLELCFECADRAEQTYQESAGVVWLPCTVCRTVQVAASEGFDTCIDCLGQV